MGSRRNPSSSSASADRLSPAPQGSSRAATPALSQPYVQWQPSAPRGDSPARSRGPGQVAPPRHTFSICVPKQIPKIGFRPLMSVFKKEGVYPFARRVGRQRTLECDPVRSGPDRHQPHFQAEALPGSVLARTDNSACSSVNGTSTGSRRPPGGSPPRTLIHDLRLYSRSVRVGTGRAMRRERIGRVGRHGCSFDDTGDENEPKTFRTLWLDVI